jgi:hypothetical protein
VRSSSTRCTVAQSRELSMPKMFPSRRFSKSVGSILASNRISVNHAPKRDGLPGDTGLGLISCATMSPLRRLTSRLLRREFVLFSCEQGCGPATSLSALPESELVCGRLRPRDKRLPAFLPPVNRVTRRCNQGGLEAGCR